MGKTISHLILEEAFRRLAEQHPDKVTRPADKTEYVNWPEETVGQMIRAYFGDVTVPHRRISKPLRKLSEHEFGVALYSLAEGSGIIEPSVVSQAHFFALAINRQGFFHRDLHERNIMVVGPPNQPQQAVAIDFGNAIHIPNLSGDDVRDYSDAYRVGGDRELSQDTQARDTLPRLLAKRG